jgi:hypothetical protein
MQFNALEQITQRQVEVLGEALEQHAFVALGQVSVMVSGWRPDRRWPAEDLAADGYRLVGGIGRHEHVMLPACARARSESSSLQRELEPGTSQEPKSITGTRAIVEHWCAPQTTRLPGPLPTRAWLAPRRSVGPGKVPLGSRVGAHGLW